MRLRIYRWWWVKVLPWPAHKWLRNHKCDGWIPRRHKIVEEVETVGPQTGQPMWRCVRCDDVWDFDPRG